jgi:hypothetical protein
LPPYPLPPQGPAQAVRSGAFRQKAVCLKGFANNDVTESFRRKFAYVLERGPDNAGIGKTGTPASRRAVCPDPIEGLPDRAGNVLLAQIHHLPEKRYHPFSSELIKCVSVQMARHVFAEALFRPDAGRLSKRVRHCAVLWLSHGFLGAVFVQIVRFMAVSYPARLGYGSCVSGICPTVQIQYMLRLIFDRAA